MSMKPLAVRAVIPARALRSALACALGPLALTAASPPGPGPEGAREPRVFEVRMVDRSATSFAFEPADLTVRPGDVIRFVQTGAVPHNVEFTGAPKGASLGGSVMGPFLTQPGEVYEVEIDGRFVPGTYPYVCTPHQVMGMVGSVTVTAAEPSAELARPGSES